MTKIKMETIVGTLYGYLHWESAAPKTAVYVQYNAFERILIRENILSTDRTAKQKWKILIFSKMRTEYDAKREILTLDIDRVRKFLTKMGEFYADYEPATGTCARECVSQE